MIAIPALDLNEALGHPPAGPTRDRHIAAMARALDDLGFGRLQIIDREAATRGRSNLPVVEEILRDTNARVQVEGVSTTSDIDQLLHMGVDHVIVGSRGIDEPEWLADIVELFPESISLVTDVRDRRVVRRGWVRTLPVDILDLVEELNDFPLRELIVSVRTFDAANRARELTLLEDVAERSHFPVLVSGVATGADDCRALEHRGISGALIEASQLLGGQMDGREIAHEFGA